MGPITAHVQIVRVSLGRWILNMFQNLSFITQMFVPRYSKTEASRDWHQAPIFIQQQTVPLCLKQVQTDHIADWLWYMQEQRFYHPSGTLCQYFTSLTVQSTSLQFLMFQFMAVAYIPIPVYPREEYLSAVPTPSHWMLQRAARSASSPFSRWKKPNSVHLLLHSMPQPLLFVIKIWSQTVIFLIQVWS